MLQFVVVLAVATVALGAPSNPITKHLVPTLDGRIVGGEDTEITSYPYQLSLLYFNSHICGAGLISPNWALTAAHCTASFGTASYFSIRYGSSIRNTGGAVSQVSRIISHEKYNSLNIDYDFSLLQLATHVVSSAGAPVSVINLASTDFPINEGKILTITGWGTISSNGPSADQLQVVEVPIVGNDNCRRAYGASAITDRMFCAGLLGVGGKDACQGDSGGPTVIDGVLVGVVSWGYGCAQPQYPGVYASVPAVREWIKANTDV